MGDVETDENEKTVLRIDCQLRDFFILVLCPLPAPTIHLLLSTPITNSDIYFKNVPIMIDFNPKIIIIFVIYFTTLNINFI